MTAVQTHPWVDELELIEITAYGDSTPLLLDLRSGRRIELWGDWRWQENDGSRYGPSFY